MGAKRLSEELVLDTAARLADAHGLDAVTVTKVAEELGVRQPALYRYIDNYDGLVRSLSLRARDQLTAAMAEAAVGLAGDEAVLAVAAAWRRFCHEHPGLYEATDRAPSTGDPEMEAAIEVVVEVIRRALTAFRLTDDAAVHAARSLRSAMHGFCHLELGREYPSPVDLDDSYDQLVHLVIAGIGAMSVRSAA